MSNRIADTWIITSPSLKTLWRLAFLFITTTSLLKRVKEWLHNVASIGRFHSVRQLVIWQPHLHLHDVCILHSAWGLSSSLLASSKHKNVTVGYLMMFFYGVYRTYLFQHCLHGDKKGEKDNIDISAYYLLLFNNVFPSLLFRWSIVQFSTCSCSNIS